MSELPDFEELEQEWDPTKLSFIDHMIAGSFAGLAEHVAIFPLDTLKTNVQCEKCGSNSPFKTINCAVRIVKQDGILRLWRGVSAMFIGCIPAHAAYFSIFETMKSLLGANGDGHFPIQAAICGAVATSTHDFIMTPLDVIKQRMQLGYHQNIYDCGKSIIQLEGVSAMYRSFPTTLLMNIPYGCIMVSTNESLRKVLNPNGKYSLYTSMVAGSIAGAVASFLTTPLDVVKTRLQTQDLTPFSSSSASSSSSSMSNKSSVLGGMGLYPRYIVSTPKSEAIGDQVCEMITKTNPSDQKVIRYSSFFQTIKRITVEEGYVALWRGAFPRMLVQAPSAAISWTAYEFAKNCLSRIKD
mmetsp:Transcript_23997/g.24586  ORF Transcript_23997/g.24586 Transcript_23997/m.24586 type:complete len:354 (-) Transcript_23997:61-1122(-)